MIPWNHKVCGTNNITYGNGCELGCAQDIDPSVQVRCQGECSQCASPGPSCVCNKIYHPVCGTDNITYGNDCQFGCAQRENPNLAKNCDDECSKCPCICPAIYSPVCGNDGVTYSNSCQLSCAARNNAGLQQVSIKPCSNSNAPVGRI